MNKKLSISMGLMALILTACGGGSPNQPPRNLDDACAIVKDRPGWLKDMQSTQRKWGVPVAVQMATIYQESKFVGDARTPIRYKAGVIPVGRQSSAYGYAQAIDSTWEWYQREEGGRRAKRTDFGDATDFIGWYFNESNERLGLSRWDAYRQYLAYHDGHTGYKRGTYRSKTWLVNIARTVEERAITYDMQLQTCT